MIQSNHVHVQKCSCPEIFLVFLITQINGSGKPKRQSSQLNRCLNKKSLFYFKFQANLVRFQSSNFLERKPVSENCSAVQKVKHIIKIRSFLSKAC